MTNLITKLIPFTFFILFVLISGCNGDEEDQEDQQNQVDSDPEEVFDGVISLANQEELLSDGLTFSDTKSGTSSEIQIITLSAENLISAIEITASSPYLLSFNDEDFSTELEIEPTSDNLDTAIYITFSPELAQSGLIEGEIEIKSEGIEDLSFSVFGTSLRASLSVDLTNFEFISYYPGSSEVLQFQVTSEYIDNTVNFEASNTSFELSLDGQNFLDMIEISSDEIINSTVYVRFTPTEENFFSGVINITSDESMFSLPTVSLEGTSYPDADNYQTFDRERVAFGGGFTQTSIKSFDLPQDLSNVSAITMFVQLTCPDDVGCDEWDVFANVKVIDPVSSEHYELARFITPYWNDNSQLIRGFEFDVTDFKSLLTGNDVELRIRTECWNARGYEVSVDFDYVKGTPDYTYYAIQRVFNYDNGSAAGVPYGISHDLDLTRTITVPANSESTHLRTIVHGWGEATPADVDGRRCSEWCYRTHAVVINQETMFNHSLDPLGCANNPVSNQSPGNWTPDRAGWCPGMEVPIRIDDLDGMSGNTFDLEYTFEDWTNDGLSDAYYPLSSFIVVKSNSPIDRAVVED